MAPREILAALRDRPGMMISGQTFREACALWDGYLLGSGVADASSFSLWISVRSGRAPNVSWAWHIAALVEGAAGMDRAMELPAEVDARCRVEMVERWVEYLEATDEPGVPSGE